jgi:3-dehydroquinate dehydratase-2
MLGRREPKIYGMQSLADVEKSMLKNAGKSALEFFQSNHEGALIDKIQAFDGDGLIINAGALSHYSYALADALKMKTCKKIEVHITNIFTREPFRHVSMLSPVCDGCIVGLGTDGYLLALSALTGKE